MSDMRDAMVQALKDVVVPLLRESDFSGSFPHFRRRRKDHIDLVTFQFDRNGGGFLIEIAQCGTEGLTTSWGERISPAKIKAWDLHPNQRIRIKPKNGSGTDSWFRFERESKDTYSGSVALVVSYLGRIEKIFEDFESSIKQNRF